MALDILDKPEHLLYEIDAAVRKRDRCLGCIDMLVKNYHGPYWGDGDRGDGYYTPENFAYEFVSVIVPRLVYSNPKVIAGSMRGSMQNMLAKGLAAAVNRVVREQPFVPVMRDCAYDMQFGVGVAMVGQARHDPDQPDSLLWPVVERVDWRAFVIDQHAKSGRKARFAAHLVVMDKQDLVRMEKEERDLPEDQRTGWDLRMIEALPEDSSSVEKLRDEHGDSVRRGEVAWWEVWVDEIHLDDAPTRRQGYNGTWFSLPADGVERLRNGRNMGYLRPPRAAFVPAGGPYTMFGTYVVPNEPWPLATLPAMEGQNRDLNEQAEAGNAAMRRYKSLGVSSGIAEADSKKLNNARSGQIVNVQSAAEVDRVLKMFEIGGISQQQINQLALLRDRRDRIAGHADTSMGVVTGAGTATENVLADSGAKMRFSLLEQMFHEGAVNVARGLGHYIWYEDRIAVPLGTGPDGQSVVVFQGGADGMAYEDLEVAIELYSMRRIDEATQGARIAQAYQMATQAVQLAAQYPSWPWAEAFGALGDALNLPDLGRLFSPEQTQALRADLMALQGQGQGGQAPASNMSQTFAPASLRQMNAVPPAPRAPAPSARPKPKALEQGGNARARLR